MEDITVLFTASVKTISFNLQRMILIEIYWESSKINKLLKAWDTLVYTFKLDQLFFDLRGYANKSMATPAGIRKLKIQIAGLRSINAPHYASQATVLRLKYLLTCTCVGIHPGRVELASPIALTTSRTEALQARRSCASSLDTFTQSFLHLASPQVKCKPYRF